MKGAAESNSWRRVEREGQFKMKWAGSSGASVTQLAGGIAGGSAVHPAAELRGVSRIDCWALISK